MINENCRLNNERLAAAHAARRKHQLDLKPSSQFIHAAIGDDRSDRHEFIEAVCAAMEKKGVKPQQRRPREQPPSRERPPSGQRPGAPPSGSASPGAGCFFSGKPTLQDATLSSQIFAHREACQNPQGWVTAYEKDRRARGAPSAAAAHVSVVADAKAQQGVEAELVQRKSGAWAAMVDGVPVTPLVPGVEAPPGLTNFLNIDDEDALMAGRCHEREEDLFPSCARACSGPCAAACAPKEDAILQDAAHAEEAFAEPEQKHTQARLSSRDCPTGQSIRFGKAWTSSSTSRARVGAVCHRRCATCMQPCNDVWKDQA